MTALTPDGLARIEELAEKATPGPWVPREYPRPGFDGTTHWVACDEGDVYVAHDCGGPDAGFIAAARTAVPALVAGVKDLQTQNAELREAYEAWKVAGTKSYNALLEIWHRVTPGDTKHMTFNPDDPDEVVAGVRSLQARITELETEHAGTRQAALRDALAEIMKDAPPLNAELTLTPAGVVEDKGMSDYVEGMHDAWAAVNSMIITEAADQAGADNGPARDAEVAAKALEAAAEKLGVNQMISEGEVREGLLAYAAAYRAGAVHG